MDKEKATHIWGPEDTEELRRALAGGQVHVAPRIPAVELDIQRASKTFSDASDSFMQGLRSLGRTVSRTVVPSMMPNIQPYQRPAPIDEHTIILDDAFTEFDFDQFDKQRTDIQTVARHHANFVRQHDHGIVYSD